MKRRPFTLQLVRAAWVSMSLWFAPTALTFQSAHLLPSALHQRHLPRQKQSFSTMNTYLKSYTGALRMMDRTLLPVRDQERVAPQATRRQRGQACSVRLWATSSSRSSIDDDEALTVRSGSRQPPFRLLESTLMHDEQRPRRIHTATTATTDVPPVTPRSTRRSKSATTTTVRKTPESDWRAEWGVEDRRQVSSGRHPSDGQEEPLAFPATVHAVAEAATRAIVAVLYHHTRWDLTVVPNAGPGPSWHGQRRPVCDAGRIGVEIDCSSNSSGKNDNSNAAAAIRHVSLVLAGKLSNRESYRRYEDETLSVDSSASRTMGLQDCLRPVAIYFNTIQQALAASEELLVLKRMQQQQQSQGGSTMKRRLAAATTQTTTYDKILIRCLCQGDDIPNEMILTADSRRRTESNHHQQKQTKTKNSTTNMSKKQRLELGQVDATAGLILVVQPTDYNDEYQPPGPALRAVGALQRLASAASVEHLPVVVMSPRFLKLQQLQQQDCADNWDHWDQSGYQQSSIYAGRAPWILRDFFPPVFCWVGHALQLSSCNKNDNEVNWWHEQQQQKQSFWYFTHLALCQSVLHEGHAWHLFAAAVSEEDDSMVKNAGKPMVNVKQQQKRQAVRYEFVCGTRSAAGRPTRQVMHRLFGEYRQQLSHNTETIAALSETKSSR